jgi:hypothetical protein
MRAYRKAILWLIVGLGFLALLGLGLSWLSPQYGEICSQTKDAAPKDCAPYDISRYAILKSLAFVQDYNGAIQALAAIIMAAFTFILAIVGHEQVKQTRILQRAYITARRRGIDVTQEGKVIGQLAFVNVGNLPARNFRAAVAICWSADPDLSEFEALPLGEEVVLPAKTKFPSGTAALRKEDAGSFFHATGGYIFVWGRATYTDGFGNSRWVKFCHRYNCKSPRNDKGGISRRYGRHHHHYNEDDGGV